MDRGTLRYALSRCWLGDVLVATRRQGACAILLGDTPAELEADLARRFPGAERRRADADLDDLVEQVVDRIEHPRMARSDLVLDATGTPFQMRVWDALQTIPSGTTATYGEIARAIGAPKATRAVAGACGANPLAVAIPCHRAIRADGGLSGYRWGLTRKRALLDRERASKTQPTGA